MKYTFFTILLSLLVLTSGLSSCTGSSTGKTTVVDSLAQDSVLAEIPDSATPVKLADSSWTQAAKSFSTDNQAHTDTTKNNPAKNADKPAQLPITKMMNPYRPKELTDGLNKAKNGDYRGAIADFDICIEKNIKNYNAYFYKAKAYIDLNEPQNALPAINLAIQNNPNQAMYYYFRGKIYADGNNQEKAFDDFDKAVSLDATFADAINYRGVTHANMGKHSEAIADYNAAIALNPEFAIAYYNKGTSEAALEKYAEALVSFSKCIELDPEKVTSYMNRGNCYVMTNDFKAAISDYSKVIAIDPKNADAYYNRGAAYQYAHDKKACDDWKKAQSLGNKRAIEMLNKYCR